MNARREPGRFIAEIDLAELFALQRGLEALAMLMIHSEVPVDVTKAGVLVDLAADRMQCLLTPLEDAANRNERAA